LFTEVIFRFALSEKKNLSKSDYECTGYLVSTVTFLFTEDTNIRQQTSVDFTTKTFNFEFTGTHFLLYLPSKFSFIALVERFFLNSQRAALAIFGPKCQQ
jgi:hypothetical protein